MLYLTSDLYGLFGFIFCLFIRGNVFSPEHENGLLSKVREWVFCARWRWKKSSYILELLPLQIFLFCLSCYKVLCQ